jgi:hypothetical protein
MKREDLTKLGLSEEQVDKVMAENGKDIEKFKTAAETVKTEAESIKAQLTEANKQIEGFKGLDIEGVKKAADEWKVKAEQAQADAVKQVSALKFDHALDGALTGAKARNAKAVKALLQSDALKLQDDGSIMGLKEQLDKIKSDNDYLFESETPTPKIVAGGHNQSVIGDAVVDAARKAAGLPPAK